MEKEKGHYVSGETLPLEIGVVDGGGIGSAPEKPTHGKLYPGLLCERTSFAPFILNISILTKGFATSSSVDKEYLTNLCEEHSFGNPVVVCGWKGDVRNLCKKGGILTSSFGGP